MLFVAAVGIDLKENGTPVHATGVHLVAVARKGSSISVPDIDKLVQRAVKGDASAYEHLARGLLRPAYAVALAIVGRPADAEDVAQDALLSAFEHIESCREPERFVAWLMTIVRNQSKNWLDRRRLRDVLPSIETPEQLAPERDIDGGLERARLLRALEELTLAEREVVLLHDLEGFTHQEISEALGISCVMSRQHLFVAHRKLRAVLKDEAQELSVEEGGSDERE